MTRSSSGGRSYGKSLMAALATMALIALAAHFTIGGLADLKMNRVRSGWERSLGSWDEILERYPAHEANPAALQVERRSAALGIDLATRSRRSRVGTAYRDVKAELGRYVDLHLEGKRRGAENPPARVGAYLQQHRREFQALRRQLLDGPQPRWETDLGKLFAAPIPNLLGHNDLQKALLADALAASARRDRQMALEGLEASWRLNRSLYNRPELITQQIAVSVARFQAGVLRHIEHVPTLWIPRLNGSEFRESLQVALGLEASFWTRLDPADPTLQREFRWTQAPVTWLIGPYVRYSAADVSGRFRKQLQNLAAVETLCDTDLAAHDADLQIRMPRWNPIGKLFAPGLGGAFDRLARLELDLELSARLIELDAARRAAAGEWPAEISEELQRSSACPSDRWRYTVGPQAEMTLAFGREISWSDQRGAVLPTSFRIGY